MEEPEGTALITALNKGKGPETTPGLTFCLDYFTFFLKNIRSSVIVIF
jgi:hypothetical protein